MRTIKPVLTEKVVLFIQQAVDAHLKSHGMGALEGAIMTVQALNVPWDEEPVATPAKPAAKAGKNEA